MKNYRFLIKFGRDEHLETFLKEGLMYCNTVKYFRALEDPKQGDSNEGCTYASPTEILKLQFKDKEGKSHELKNLSIKGTYRENDPLYNYHLFCLYGADEGTLQEFINGRRSTLIEKSEFDFGTHFVLINNPKVFVERVVAKLQAEKLNARLDEVTYVDHTRYRGEMGIFKKSDFYKSQNEVRFAIDGKSDEPILIKIGDISDIASPILHKSELDDLKLVLCKER